MIKAVLFDKDGTLIELGNTWDKPTIGMMRDLFSESDLSQDEQDQLAFAMGIKEDWSGIKANSIFAAGSIYDQAAYLEPYLSWSIPEIEDRMEASYLKYLQEEEVMARLTPGSAEALESLKDDYVIGLITNDNYVFARQMLENLGVLSYFDFIGCADQYGPKPNPRALHEIAKQYNIGLSEMVYVGDSALDMTYAKPLAAAIGYLENEESHLHLTEADYLLDHMSDLPQILEQINQKGVEG